MFNMLGNIGIMSDVMQKAELLKQQKLPPEICDEIAKQIIDAVALWGMDGENIKNILEALTARAIHAWPNVYDPTPLIDHEK